MSKRSVLEERRLAAAKEWHDRCQRQRKMLGAANKRIKELETALAEARDAIDQALDDMRDGHCVAPITKDLLCAAIGVENA